MSSNDLLPRCLRVAAELNVVHEWGLGPDDLAAYARAVAALNPGRPPDDTRLALCISSYHHDHGAVEALTDSAHPAHDQAWQRLHYETRRLLASKGAHAMLGESVVGPEDLAQEAMADLWRGIGQFRYQSRLQTWVFAVVGHCLGRAVRSGRAQRRAAAERALSLDALREADGEPASERPSHSPDEAALLGLLTSLLAQSLARQPDQRLAVVVQLWAVEQQTLREIGARLQLSVGRVHALLAEARYVLHSDPALRAWFDASFDELSAAPGHPPLSG